MLKAKSKGVDVMSNKKFSKLAVLSLLGVLSLAGCSDSSSKIYAKPSNYKDEIVEVEGYEDQKIHNDILKIIYDAMHDGDVPAKTLDKVLYRFAESVYGPYNLVTRSEKDESITLKAAAANAKEVGTADYSTVNAFIKAHKSYWNYDENGKHVDDNGDPIDDKKDWTPGLKERTNVSDKWDDIEDRIAETMYSKISSGSYSSKHFFSEVKLVRSLYEGHGDVDYRTASKVDGTGSYLLTPMIIPYTLEGKDVFKTTPTQKAVLNRALYQTNYELGQDETKDVEYSANNDTYLAQYHYIEDEIIETIYNDLLVEQYLLDEELAAVRNSRARLINVLKIEKYSTFTFNASLLVKKLVEDIYSSTPSVREGHEDLHYIDYVDDEHNPYEELFKSYANMSKGLISELSEDELDILADINAQDSDTFKIVTGDLSGKEYYEHTTYGDLVEEYEELLKATDYESLDKTLYDKYTSNGTCTYEEGFDQQEISIAQTESITKGWYIQKSSPSFSNSEINDRLFQLSVANSKIEAMDELDEKLDASVDASTGLVKGELARADRIEYKEGGWAVREEPSEYENKFLCSINGAFFLKSSGSYAEDDYKNDIVFEDDSAYYIVQVIEAAKDAKLRNSTSKSSYITSRGQTFLNEVVAHITRKVAETGSYSSLAKEHWLEKMSIKYHDQKVYDYFKDNYPDLFEDD